MNMLYTPREELYSRIGRLQKLLVGSGIDGALIVQKADLFYFAGTCQNAHLLIPGKDEPTLIVKKSLKRAQQESRIGKITPGDFHMVSKAVASAFNRTGRLGLEMDVVPANLFLKYKSSFSPLEVVDVSKLIRETRAIKSAYEIERMKESARLNNVMFSEIERILREGMTEVELAGELESIYRKNGHQGAIRMRGFNQEIFYGHLMSGWNLSYSSFFDGPTGGTGLNPSYPQSAGFKKICRNEPIMVDYVGVYNGYMVDQARIFAIGTLPDKLVETHEVALRIKRQIAQEGLPGANGKDLYDTASKIAAEAGCEQYFMGCGDPVGFIGHGIGIELDELPVIAKNLNVILKPGMTFALEPKFIFPEIGAVGIEDTFVVAESGLEQITYFDESIQFL
jgi:Xaa-Pro aminopeptidase